MREALAIPAFALLMVLGFFSVKGFPSTASETSLAIFFGYVFATSSMLVLGVSALRGLDRMSVAIASLFLAAWYSALLPGLAGEGELQLTILYSAGVFVLIAAGVLTFLNRYSIAAPLVVLALVPGIRYLTVLDGGFFGVLFMASLLIGPTLVLSGAYVLSFK